MNDYIELEYIESSGTQYINTNYIFNGIKNKIYADFVINEFVNSGWVTLCATQKNSSTRFGAIQFYGYKNYLTAGDKAGDNGINLGDTLLNTRYQIEVITNTTTQKLNVERSDNKIGELTITGSVRTDLPIYIFCKNTNSTTNENIKAKLYRYKIMEDDVLVRDFIPVKRKSDNKVCLYDKVTKQYFTNQGTGNFIAGPEISEPTIKDNIYLIGNKIVNLINLSAEILYGYKELEYIESTGAQYIDIGCKPNNNTSIEIEAQHSIDGLNSVSIIFGSEHDVNDGPVSTFYIGKAASSNYNYYFVFNNRIYNNSIDSSFYSQRHLYKVNKNKFYIDNNLLVTATNTTFQALFNAYLFASNYEGNADFKAKAKLYSFKMWDDDTLIRDFIPVKRLSDNEICLYDKVTNQYFTNKGTGTFIGGLPKNPTTEDILNDSLYHYQSTEASNSREINTGIAQNKLGISTMLFKIKPTAWTNYYGLIGKHTGGTGIRIQWNDCFSIEYGNSGNGGVYLPLEAIPINITSILIVFRDSSNTLWVYRNNVLLGKKENSDFVSYGNLYLGKSYDASDRYFHGYIYQFYVWNRTFTKTQLTDLYNYFKD